MSLPALENLLRIGQLKAEPRNPAEVKRMLAMARTRLLDASLPIRLTHQATTGSVWSSWKSANPSHCLSFNGCFPAKLRVQTILRGFGGQADSRAPHAASMTKRSASQRDRG